MAKQAIDRGTVANDGTGDNLRDGASKINDNFDEIYTLLGDGTTLTSDDVVLRTASQTLTTKTISGSSNTLTNIANSSLTNSSITLVDDSSTSATISLGETLAITGGTGVDTTVSGDSISIGLTNSGITVVDDSSTSATISLGETLSITGGTGVDTTISGDGISISVSNIPNSALTNSGVTVVDDSSTSATISLGETLSITGGTGIDTAVSGDGVSISVSNIPNSALTNSGITLVDESSSTTTISLGESLKITGGSGIDTTISGDGVSIAVDSTIALKPVTTTATGDGSTLVFTLASSGTTDSVIIFVNGTFQVPTTDYSVSGTTLTFTSPPAGSAVIVIKEF